MKSSLEKIQHPEETSQLGRHVGGLDIKLTFLFGPEVLELTAQLND